MHQKLPRSQASFAAPCWAASQLENYGVSVTLPALQLLGGKQETNVANNRKVTDNPIQCGHCNNYALMFVLAEAKEELSEIADHDYREFQILLCPSCHQVNVLCHNVAEELEYDGIDNEEVALYYQTEYLFPQRRAFAHLPALVSQSYRIAATLLLVEPIACAVFVGRTLEFVCKDRQAQGHTLEKMLNDLASRGEIPNRLLEMAHGLRYFRNIGAHASELSVSRDDVKTLLNICEVILEYVYEAPAMLQQAQARITELKSQPNKTA